MFRPSSLAVGVAAALFSALPAASQPAGSTPQPEIDDVISVTGARRREEAVQEVPIPVSVVDGELITEAGAFNVNRIKELIPSVQLYSSNPRNTGVNIRGLGSPFGLTNDGIEPGVGYYVDGVLYARPASTTLDFIDVERVEVLRGPQGTLFGKNTTAGAILLTTRKPSFTPEYDFELGYGDDAFMQAKGSVSGPLGEKVAGRISLTSTQRDGLLYNVATQREGQRHRQHRRAHAAARHAERARRHHVLARLHGSKADRLRASVRGLRPDAAFGLPAVRHDHCRSRATRRRAAIRSTASSITTRRGSPATRWAAWPPTSMSSSVPAR